MPLPGGFTNFCGRIYGISKKNEDFKACLGLELRADEEVEAALRVSCFSFGPRGLKVMEAEPIPVAPIDEEEGDNIVTLKNQVLKLMNPILFQMMTICLASAAQTREMKMTMMTMIFSAVI